MGAAAIPIVLVFLLVFVGWRVVLVSNRDLVRTREWGELARRALPFIVLTLMAVSVFPVQLSGNDRLVTAWALVFAAGVLFSSTLAIPAAERKASKAFRRGDYGEAAELYRQLAEEKPIARHHAFLSAALGAAGRNEEAVEAATRAVELDPQYGLAYYNRALILQRMGRRSRANRDLKRALEADLPRRYRNAARQALEEKK